MKRNILFAFICLALLLNSGCATRLAHFEKRKYMKGYHVDFAQKKINKSKHSSVQPVALIPATDAKEASAETGKSTFTENENNVHLYEESVSAKTSAQAFAPVKKKNIFRNPLAKSFGKGQLNRTLKKGFQKIMPKKKTAIVNDRPKIYNLLAWGIVFAAIALTMLVLKLLIGPLTMTYLIFIILFFLGGVAMIICGIIYQ